jgi:hypothetical protein
MFKEIWKVIVSRVEAIKFLNPPRYDEGQDDYRMRANYSLITLAFFAAYAVFFSLAHWLEIRWLSIIALACAFFGMVCNAMTLYRDEKIEKQKEERAQRYAARNAQEQAENPKRLQRQRDWLIAFYGENKDLVSHAIPPLFFQGYLRAHHDHWCELNDLELLLNALRTHAFLRRLYEKYRPVIGEAYSEAHFEERLAELVGAKEYTNGEFDRIREPGLGRWGGQVLEKELTDLYERLKAAAEAKKAEASAEPKPSADLEAEIQAINDDPDREPHLKEAQIKFLRDKHQETVS